MTSLTGSTAATLSGTVAPPTVQAALLGSVAQIATLSAVWLRYTSVASCVPDPRGCWHDPWARQVLITLAICLSLWLLSLRTIRSKGTSDPSIVDRLWSILPWLYCWHWYGSAPTPRGLLLATLASIWGLRLTANFARKGGFSGGEDYRWAEIRTWPGFDRGWEVFNLLFICGFQQLVLLAFSSPAAAAASSDVPLNALDGAATALYLLLLAGEATADRQMMRFQTEKYRRLRAKEPLGAEFGRGFLCSGLWRYSRHPNYFCEVAIWWAFYLFSLAAGLPLVNWTISGATFLTCLFVLPHASLDVTEVLSSRKYPQYAEYQATVSRFFPLPPLPAGERAPMRPVDAVLIGWFCVGLAVTFLVDIEAVLVQRPDLYGLDAAHTPLWPPEPCVRAVRWWSAAADPLMHARPVWFRAAIWVEVLVQAPFYAVAIYAFVRQRSWVRVPAIVYATVLLTIMPIVLAEQYFGPHASRRPLLVTAVYGAYVLMPVLLLVRVWSVDVFPSTPLAKRKAAGLAGGEAAAPAARRVRSPARKRA